MFKIIIRSLFISFVTAFIIFTSVPSQAALTQVPGKISAPVILYDEGGNTLATGDYGILVSLKDDLGNALYTEEQVVRVKDGVAQFVLGDGYEPGSDSQKPTGGLVLEDFVTANVVNVEILVEGQFSPQEITTLGSQPYSFVSQQSLTVAADAILSASIQDGTITPADVSADFTQAIIAEVLRQIPVSTPPPTVGDLINSLSASKISISANLALKNASGTNIEQILKGLDQAIETLREIHLKQGLANLRAEVVLRDGTQAMTGNLNMGGQDVINIGSAGYSLVALLGSIPPGQTLADTFVDTAGDTMTGNLSMGSQDITSIGPRNFSLVTVLGNLPINQPLEDVFVNVSGDLMDGILNMGGFNIEGIGVNRLSTTALFSGFPTATSLEARYVNYASDELLRTLLLGNPSNPWSNGYGPNGGRAGDFEFFGNGWIHGNLKVSGTLVVPIDTDGDGSKDGEKDVGDAIDENLEKDKDQDDAIDDIEDKLPQDSNGDTVDLDTAYLRLDGTNVMDGNLGMNNNDIENVGKINGYAISDLVNQPSSPNPSINPTPSESTAKAWIRLAASQNCNNNQSFSDYNVSSVTAGQHASWYCKVNINFSNAMSTNTYAVVVAAEDGKFSHRVESRSQNGISIIFDTWNGSDFVGYSDIPSFSVVIYE